MLYMQLSGAPAVQLPRLSVQRVWVSEQVCVQGMCQFGPVCIDIRRLDRAQNTRSPTFRRVGPYDLHCSTKSNGLTGLTGQTRRVAVR